MVATDVALAAMCLVALEAIEEAFEDKEKAACAAGRKEESEA